MIIGLGVLVVLVLTAPGWLAAAEAVARRRRWGKWADPAVRAAWGWREQPVTYPPPVERAEPRTTERLRGSARVARPVYRSGLLP